MGRESRISTAKRTASGANVIARNPVFRGAAWGFVLVGLVLAVSCGGAKDKTIADELVTLRDGQQWSYKLEPGRYRLESTATGDGVSVEWLGADCPAIGERRTTTSLCELTRTGQVVVTNPTLFGLGASSSVTIKVTKLAK